MIQSDQEAGSRCREKRLLILPLGVGDDFSRAVILSWDLEGV